MRQALIKHLHEQFHLFSEHSYEKGAIITISVRGNLWGTERISKLPKVKSAIKQ